MTDKRYLIVCMGCGAGISRRDLERRAPAGIWELWHVACPECGRHELRPRSEERYLRSVNRAYWAR
jgi:DNA-directed RNA polymerase subunit RPC12/RpoP